MKRFRSLCVSAVPENVDGAKETDESVGDGGVELITKGSLVPRGYKSLFEHQGVTQQQNTSHN